MPRMTGEKLAREMIRIQSDIPVLLCTGNSETISEEKAAGLGIKSFLLKPIAMNVLSEKIRELLVKTPK
jgi:DNA-binding response OmpR family regulator